MTRPRRHSRRQRFGRLVRMAAVAAGLVLACRIGIDPTQDAAANGDTRAITILHEHTKESATITFRRDGAYDPEALKQLDWILRDWRLDEPTRMDPRLFDIVWQVYREIGSQAPIHVVSAYRSPHTNAMLRRRSRAVAEHSQHMLGKAMDFYLPDVPMSRVREFGMKLQRGGVGFYPNAMNPFVHLDAGGVRSWPRMPRTQLASLFPDGRTVHMPRDGKPLAGYEEAKATILARGGSVPGMAAFADAEEPMPRRSLWAAIFGGSRDEDADYYGSPASRSRGAGPRAVAAYTPAGNSDDAGTRGFFSQPAGPIAQVSEPSPPAPLPQDGRIDSDAPVRAVGIVPLPPRRPADLVPLLAAPAALPLRPITLAMAGHAELAGFDLVPDPVPDLPRFGLPGADLIRGEMSPPAHPAVPMSDERSALKALFEAVLTPSVPVRLAGIATSRTRPEPLPGAATIGHLGAHARLGPDVRTVFSSARLDAPSPEGFSGPAIVRLPGNP